MATLGKFLSMPDEEVRDRGVHWRTSYTGLDAITCCKHGWEGEGMTSTFASSL